MIDQGRGTSTFGPAWAAQRDRALALASIWASGSSSGGTVSYEQARFLASVPVEHLQHYALEAATIVPEQRLKQHAYKQKRKPELQRKKKRKLLLLQQRQSE